MFLKRCFIVTVALAILTNCQPDEKVEEEDLDYTVFETVDLSAVRAGAVNKKGCGPNMKCVTYYLCSETGTVVKDGSYLIDERLDLGEPEVPEDSVCPTMAFCCDLDDLQVPPPENQCKTYKPPAKCGVRNLKGLGDPVKSIQGVTQYANYAEFPWLMAVSNQTTFLGGGALINPKVVLTAAHIFKYSKGGRFKVRGGEYNTQTEQEICPHVDKNGKNLIIHPEFVPRNLQNDVALLILDEPFKMTAWINTICLPPADMNFDHKKCVSGGWGKKNYNVVERYQVFPKVLNLPVVPHDKCETMFQDTRLGEDFVLHESFLCAGGEEGIDVCTGDGGSPLVCESQTRGHYYVAGIVAGGINCGEKNVPGFYVNVPYFRDWIDEQLDALGLTGATLN